MQIQINTDTNIEGNEALAAYVRNETEHALSHFSDHITRVEVHLSDENSDKKVGNDTMRCVMEVRLEGRHPLAVTHQAATMEQALNGAADKVSRLIENTIGRINGKRGHRVEPSQSELDEQEE
ncbi:MAG: HPF/RaiA family ribosome-associated protein [Geobacteraceae bacterium]